MFFYTFLCSNGPISHNLLLHWQTIIYLHSLPAEMIYVYVTSSSCLGVMLRVWQFYDRKIHARFKAITKLIRLDDETIYPNNVISGRLRLPVLTNVDMLYRSYMWSVSVRCRWVPY